MGRKTTTGNSIREIREKLLYFTSRGPPASLSVSPADIFVTLHTHRYFDSAVWMQPRWRLALPLRELQYAVFHHRPNKYTAEHRRTRPKLPGWNPNAFNYLSLEEVGIAFQPCAKTNLSHLHGTELERGHNYTLRTEGNTTTCDRCAAVAISLEKPWMAPSELGARYRCLELKEVKWPSYTGHGGLE